MLCFSGYDRCRLFTNWVLIIRILSKLSFNRVQSRDCDARCRRSYRTSYISRAWAAPYITIRLPNKRYALARFVLADGANKHTGAYEAIWFRSLVLHTKLCTTDYIRKPYCYFISLEDPKSYVQRKTNQI